MGEQSDRLVCDIAFVKIKDNTLSKAIFKKKNASGIFLSE